MSTRLDPPAWEQWEHMTLEDAYASGRADEREEWLPVLEALQRFARLDLTAPIGAIVHEDFGMDVLHARAAIDAAMAKEQQK